MIDRYKATLRTMVVDDFVTSLIKCGWVAEIPEHQRDTLLQQVRAQFDKDRWYTFLALGTFSFDSECIYGFGPGNSSYYDMMTEIARYSEGFFHPTDIVDERKGDWINVSFRQNKQTYRCRVHATDYFQEDVLDVINQAISDAGSEKRFIILPPVDQCMHIVYISYKTYKYAERRGLIPPPEYFCTSPDLLEDYLRAYWNDYS
jgi:hypothetical protein